MHMQGEVIGIAPYVNITDQQTGVVSSGLSIYVLFDGDSPDPWLGRVPHKFWLPDHSQCAHFNSPEGRKTQLPKKAAFNCSLSAKGALKVLDFKFLA